MAFQRTYLYRPIVFLSLNPFLVPIIYGAKRNLVVANHVPNNRGRSRRSKCSYCKKEREKTFIKIFTNQLKPLRQFFAARRIYEKQTYQTTTRFASRLPFSI